MCILFYYSQSPPEVISQHLLTLFVDGPRTGQEMRLPLRNPVQKQPLPVQAHHQPVQTEQGREQGWRQLARV